MVLIDIALVVLSIVGLILIILGFQKSKQSYILFGGIAFFAILFYLIGWTFLLPMAPPMALAISFFARKKKYSA